MFDQDVCAWRIFSIEIIIILLIIRIIQDIGIVDLTRLPNITSTWDPRYYKNDQWLLNNYMLTCSPDFIW